MIRQAALATALLLGSSLAGHAATVTSISAAQFAEACDACEIAVPTIRSGNRALNGDWEVAVSDGGAASQQLQWVTGQPAALSLSYASATNLLSLQVTGQGRSVTSSGTIDLSAANAIFVRARASTGGTSSFTDLVLNGQAVGGLSSDGSMPGGATFLQLGDVFDGTGDFTLTGSLVFDFGTAARVNGSNFAGQFKIGTVEVAPVPLPAAGLLLLAGLGALGALRARRGA